MWTRLRKLPVSVISFLLRNQKVPALELQAHGCIVWLRQSLRMLTAGRKPSQAQKQDCPFMGTSCHCLERIPQSPCPPQEIPVPPATSQDDAYRKSTVIVPDESRQTEAAPACK